MSEFLEAIHKAFDEGLSFEEMRDLIDMVEREKEAQAESEHKDESE